jgi:FixJ family two-component response regulator
MYIRDNGSRGKVFVIDDDRPMRMAIARLLRAAGFEVDVLADGGSYLEQPVPKLPACLVVDLRMPLMSGFDLQRAIRGTTHALPIVFITGAESSEIRQQAFVAGAVDMLLKPLDRTQLLTAVERALEVSARSVT